jgi:hypothetical protein
MTQGQNNALNMYNAVLQYLDENSGIWNNVTPVANQQAHLKSVVDSINSKSEEQQGKSTEGYTASKNAAMETMVNLAYKMALKIKGYAKKAGNKVILQSVDISISNLQSGSSREVINRCKIIAATAQANLSHLAEYKVTPADITTVRDAISNAIPKTAERDATSAERRGITLTLPSMFSEAGEEASDLDDLIEGLIDNEDFVTGYFAVRRINDMRGGKSKKEEKEKVNQ